MIILNQINDGHVTSARSDDGLVTAPRTPTTTLYGEFALIDTDGRPMWRGVYLDDRGMATDDLVPAGIWASAVQLMRDWAEHQGAREDAASAHALERDIARHNSLGERIAQDMDRADSDL